MICGIYELGFIHTARSFRELSNTTNSNGKKKMALVNVTNVEVYDNPTLFTNPFQFELTFECFSPLEDGKIRFPSLCSSKEHIDTVNLHFLHTEYKF